MHDYINHFFLCAILCFTRVFFMLCHVALVLCHVVSCCVVLARVAARIVSCCVVLYSCCVVLAGIVTRVVFYNQSKNISG